MEEVWRSYGPLEPIGSKSGARRSSRALIAGVAAVCVAGAAAGLWLQMSGEPPRAPAAARSASADPGQSDLEALAQAAELQAELQLAVSQGAPQPLGLETAAPRTELFYPPLPAQAPAPASPPSSPITLDRARAPERPPQPRASARPAPSPAPIRSAQAPVIVASNNPAPVRIQPRTAPPLRPTTTPAAPPAPVVAPAPPKFKGPSFDCAQASGGAEQIVCGSPELAALDRRLSAELQAAIAAGHNPAELQRDQADWRRRREAAAPDPRAVADIYQRRIGQLRSMQ